MKHWEKNTGSNKILVRDIKNQLRQISGILFSNNANKKSQDVKQQTEGGGMNIEIYEYPLSIQPGETPMSNRENSQEKETIHPIKKSDRKKKVKKILAERKEDHILDPDIFDGYISDSEKNIEKEEEKKKAKVLKSAKERGFNVCPEPIEVQNLHKKK